MNTRYLTGVCIALLGGFVVVASQAFSFPTTAWLAFGIAIAILVISVVAQLDRGRGLIQRTLDGVISVLAIWTIIASLVFNGATVMWLSFAEGLGFVLLAFAGMTGHEVGRWRAGHGLVPARGEAKEREPAVRAA
jgi:hypothetical protein